MHIIRALLIIISPHCRRLRTLHVCGADRLLGNKLHVRTRSLLRAGQRHGAVCAYDGSGGQREWFMGRRRHQLTTAYGIVRFRDFTLMFSFTKINELWFL